MTQTNNRFFDEVARLMNDAAGVAPGVRREFDTMMRTQAERILRELDVVQREEFEAVKEMARLAREENEALKARIAALEAKLGGGSPAAGAGPGTGGGSPLSANPPATEARAHRRDLPISLSFRAFAAISPLACGPDTPGGTPRRNRQRNQHLRIPTMATVNELSATARPKAGKGAARAVRREGRVPGVIYGDSKEPLGVSLDFKELKLKIYAGHFLTTVCNLDVDGTKHRVIPRDFQLDPVMDNPLHVDFLRLGEGAQVRVRVPIHVKNADQAPGIKRGGTVNIVTHTISRAGARPTTSRRRSRSISPGSTSTIRAT